MVSSSMRAKVAAYSLALILHMNHMMADLTLLHRDLGITEARWGLSLRAYMYEQKLQNHSTDRHIYWHHLFQRCIIDFLHSA